jgi:hypothetical protein
MKISVPELPSHFVSRPRLLTALESGAEPVTLVCAPPGYGKTLLLADWTRRTTDATAWVSLDHNDNDPERLSAVIAAAVASCGAVPADSAVHREACPAVHLPFQEFDFGVGALDRAVAVGHAQPGDDGGLVFAQPADEGVRRGKFAGLDCAHPVFEIGAAPGGEQFGEGADVLGQGRQVRAGSQVILQVTALVFGQVRGSGHDL